VAAVGTYYALHSEHHVMPAEPADAGAEPLPGGVAADASDQTPPMQLPSEQDGLPVSEPGTPKPLYTPADQNYTPIEAPSDQSGPVTLPGTSSEPIAAGSALDVDPQTGTVTPKSRSEAESVLEAERQGFVRNPRRPDLARGEPNLDFVVDNGYADIKTPISPAMRPLSVQALDIASKVQTYDPNVTVIIDLKNLSPAEKVEFQTELGKAGGVTSQVEFVNI